MTDDRSSVELFVQFSIIMKVVRLIRTYLNSKMKSVLLVAYFLKYVLHVKIFQTKKYNIVLHWTRYQTARQE
jgi:hypothetical protein